MKPFDSQEKSDTELRLRALLSTIVAPAKKEQDWDRLENDLFAALDNQKQAARKTVMPRFVSALPRFSVAYAAAAVLVLSVAGIGLRIAYHKAADNASTASLASIRGTVAVQWQGEGLWDTLSSASASGGKTVKAGTVIAPLAASSAVVFLDKGSVIKVFERSSLVIKASTATQAVCFLAQGSVLVKAQKRTAGQRFEVRTPRATCSVVGTIFRVDADAMEKTTLSVYQGKVRMTPASGHAAVATLVSTGRQMTVSRDGKVAFGRITESSTPIRDISVLSMLVEHPDTLQNRASVIDITSRPEGAKVMIDNVMAGTTPCMIRRPAGRYSLVMCSDGYNPYEGTIEVGNDRIVNFTADLSRSAIAIVPKRHTPVSPASQRKQSENELRLIPAYVEALVNISSGEFQAALAILDSLSKSGLVDLKQRMCILEKINTCYKKLGDFGHASDVLEERLLKSDSQTAKGQILWELANMRANCLGDYEGAEMALVEFLILQPDAMWAHDAYSKLAEIQYYLNKYKSAAQTYRKHIAAFPDDPDIDHSMFNLAFILGRDLGDCGKAAGLYSRLLNSFHASKYRSAALFRRAECYLQMGKTDEAIRDYRAYLTSEPEGIWRSACISTLKKCKIL